MDLLLTIYRRKAIYLIHNVCILSDESFENNTNPSGTLWPQVYMNPVDETGTFVSECDVLTNSQFNPLIFSSTLYIAFNILALIRY